MHIGQIFISVDVIVIKLLWRSCRDPLLGWKHLAHHIPMESHGEKQAGKKIRVDWKMTGAESITILEEKL